MKTIASNAEIDKSGIQYTNHSIGKTTVQKLHKAGLSKDKIAAIRHRSEKAL